MVTGYEALYRKALVSRTPTRHDDVRLPGGRRGVQAPVATGTAA
jgi:hypothetical protein